MGGGGARLFSNSFTTLTVEQPGFSLLGWASTDRDGNWTYRGKVIPPVGWSIGPDPSIAEVPDYSAVYAAAIAVGPSATLYNGVCVAESKDMGVTFSEVACHEVRPPGALLSVDLSAVAFDSANRVWFATVDQNVPGVRVFRSSALGPGQPLSAATFSEVLVPGLTRDTFEPRLKLVAGEDVYVTVRYVHPDGERLDLLVYNVPSDTWYLPVDLFDICGVTDVLTPGNPATRVWLGDGRPLRAAFDYDYAVGLSEQNNPLEAGRIPVLRLAVTRQPFAQDTHVQIYETADYATCVTDYSSRDDSFNEWALGYLSVLPSFPEATAHFTGAWIRRPLKTPPYTADSFLNPIVGPALGTYSGSNKVCARGSDFTTGFYWGDYFGINQARFTVNDVFQWHGVSTFTESIPLTGEVIAPDCDFETAVYARPHHVAGAHARPIFP